MADRDEYITLNSVELALDGAWRVIDPGPLLAAGRQRGRDRVVPGADGVKVRPRALGQMNVVLAMHVFGLKNQAGTVYADQRLGLRDNIAYLKTNLLPPYGASDFATIVHTFSDAATRSGTCVVNELAVASTFEFAGGRAAVVTLDVTVLEGELT